MKSNHFYRTGSSASVLASVALFVGISITGIIIMSLLGIGQPSGYTPSPNLPLPAYVFLALFCGSFILAPLWMLSVRIRLTEVSISYWSIFSRKTVQLTSISQIVVYWAYVTRGRLFTLQFYDSFGSKLLNVTGPQPFNQSDLIEIVTLIKKSNPQVEIIDKTGKLPKKYSEKLDNYTYIL